MSENRSTYQRYHIETGDAPDRVPWPSRFKVRVSRLGLAKLLISETLEFGPRPEIVMSRPCVYGVFSGPIGGFAPRSELCVGCLRCSTQYPEWVQVLPNPARERLGDSFFTSEQINAVAYESATGRVPVKGAGYRGRFGGEGWDSMWTDMSEIVRPTRDGIHGREFISTEIDIGLKHNYLTFDSNGRPAGPVPETFSLPIPMLLDSPPPAVADDDLYKLLSGAAAELDTLLLLPVRTIVRLNLRGPHIVPLLKPAEIDTTRVLPSTPRLIMLDGAHPAQVQELAEAIRSSASGALIGLRTPFISAQEMLDFVRTGLRIFHFTASYHGRDPEGVFVFDRIREAHEALVEARIREEVTLLGSGGIIAAEHVPKAIIAGLDAVVLDTPILVALQALFDGEFRDRRSQNMRLPRRLDPGWGRQRIKNLMASWRDQLLEILGAMGLREVRRLRGEIGRAMFLPDLERQAFGEIDGYE